MHGVLALEDGTIFIGRPFGSIESWYAGCRGEVTFATNMTGYQEVCTDPSYFGQMVCLTYPLIGNYGVTFQDSESCRPWVSALLVREHADEYSNWRACESLDSFLARHGIPALCEFDTRALTRLLRTKGTMRGVLRAFDLRSQCNLDALVAEAAATRDFNNLDFVAQVP